MLEPNRTTTPHAPRHGPRARAADARHLAGDLRVIAEGLNRLSIAPAWNECRLWAEALRARADLLETEAETLERFPGCEGAPRPVH